MNYKNVFKRETKVVAIVVIALTLVVIGSSYALFMQVDDNDQNQVVTAGTLTIVYKNGNEVNPSANVEEDGTTCLTPMGDEDGKTNGCNFQLSIENKGTLPMKFDLLIYNGSSTTDLVSYDYIKYHLTQRVTNAVPDSSSLNDLQGTEVESAKKLSELQSPQNQEEENNKDKKVLTSGVIQPKQTIEYTLKIWIDDQAPESIINKQVDLQLDVAGTVDEDSANKTSADEEPTSDEEVIMNGESTPVTTKDTQDSKETETQE